ncbi:MAG: NUDIX hydrolase [Acidobacteriota bacterium]
MPSPLTAPRKGSRRYPKHPLPGVGALIFKQREGRGAILIVQRGGSPLKGYWSLPGGLVETGESLEEAVRREVLEETGLRVRPTRMFGLFERIMRDAKGKAEYHYLLADYVCKVEGGRLQAGDDTANVEWVRRADLKKYQMTEGTLDVIEKAYDAAQR